MATVPSSFSNGTVANSAAKIFRANGSVYVTYISLFNTHATTQVIKVYIKRNNIATLFQIRRFSRTQNTHAVITDNIPLSLGDEIHAVTTTASAVDYIVGGETVA